MPPLAPALRAPLLGIVALALIVALAVGPVSGAIEAQEQIAAARERLTRAQAAAIRPPQRAPLVAADAEALLAAFRTRLDALAAERAAVIDTATVEPDPAEPTLPRLRADLRGTAEGLYGLLHVLESEAPLIAVEEADLSLRRPADAETGRPTVMRARLTVRGLVPLPKPEAGGRGP